MSAQRLIGGHVIDSIMFVSVLFVYEMIIVCSGKAKMSHLKLIHERVDPTFFNGCNWHLAKSVFFCVRGFQGN